MHLCLAVQQQAVPTAPAAAPTTTVTHAVESATASATITVAAAAATTLSSGGYAPYTTAFSFVDGRDREVLKAAMRTLLDSNEAAAAAFSEHAINGTLWPQVVSRLRKRLLNSPAGLFPVTGLAGFHAFLSAAYTACVAGGPSTNSPAALSAFTTGPCLALAAIVGDEYYGEELRAARTLHAATDLRAPHTWFPLARAMKRRIIFHAGPTNSGKTYHALQALREAHSGVYCGPLRLLALEVYESLNLDGCPTSLMTGQERREMPFARHTSSTIEMVPNDVPVDVAVVDEIQMIGDSQRGHAWTRVLLGLPCREIHVCGDPAAVPAVTAIVEACGDTLEVRTYTRLSTLEVCDNSLDSDYGRVRPGDCIVAFSRRDIYTIRRTIERKTAHKCCVVYGQLPPETRSQQARLFNDPASEYKVLVASDAIGMGLNLNIRRIVFHTMDKFDGTGHGLVAPAQVKQIAGRAGRHNSAFPIGYATTLTDDDLPYLAQCWGAASSPITHAGLFPNAEQLQHLASKLPPGTDLSRVVDEFVSASRLDGPYFMCRADELKTVANVIQHLPLTLAQRCALTLMPVNLRNAEVRAYLIKYLIAFTDGAPVLLDVQLPLNSPDYLVRDLASLEDKHLVLDVYMWLAQRLSGGVFPDLGKAVKMKAEASAMLEASLTHLSEDTKSGWEREVNRRGKRSRQQAAAAAAAAAGRGQQVQQQIQVQMQQQLVGRVQQLQQQRL